MRMYMKKHDEVFLKIAKSSGFQAQQESLFEAMKKWDCWHLLYKIMLLGDFFKSIIFSPSNFVVSGCRWGKISYWKILPNHFSYICLNAWGDFSYFSFLPNCSLFFWLKLGRFFKTAKFPPIWLSMAYMATYKPCPIRTPSGRFMDGWRRIKQQK